jgi:enoyl-CoA hydratase/carnithine racemase
MNDSPLLLTRDVAVATVTLNRPQRRNALDLAQWDRLGDTMLALDADESLRAIVIRGAGAAFAAGGDIEEFPRVRRTPEEAKAYDRRVMRATAAIARNRHPVIAAIAGDCIGGGLEIACMCDFRIATESARFGIPVTRLGMAAPPEELAALVALVGVGVAMELLVEARLIGAREAFDKGLVTRVVADDGLDEALAAMTQRIASGAPLAVRAHKRVLRAIAAEGRPSQADIDAAYACIASADFREGVAAFLAKHAPRFEGR